MTDRQDLLQQIASAGARMDPGLSDRDVERLVEGGLRRRRRLVVRRVLLAGATASIAVAVTALLAQQRSGPTSPSASVPANPAVEPTPAADRTVRLDDGSTATPLDSGSEIAVLARSPARIRLSLSRGSGRFEVAPRPERAFSVQAGEVTVTVVGTAFTVERIADRVGVAVERGTVRVAWATGFRLLGQGESGWFPPLGASAQPEPQLAPRPASKLAKVKAKALVGPSEVEPATAPPARHESAEALLLAADNMRLAGHPERGAELLRKLLREHGSDPRAPLAAFTLGRVLLMELGRPREAAAAFAEVRRLSPDGAFAEDALAREVEGWSQAGQTALARARAAEYLRRYPAGRRAATVRSLGGME
jgi:transmembrane sensor